MLSVLLFLSLCFARPADDRNSQTSVDLEVRRRCAAENEAVSDINECIERESRNLVLQESSRNRPTQPSTPPPALVCKPEDALANCEKHVTSSTALLKRSAINDSALEEVVVECRSMCTPTYTYVQRNYLNGCRSHENPRIQRMLELRSTCGHYTESAESRALQASSQAAAEKAVEAIQDTMNDLSGLSLSDRVVVLGAKAGIAQGEKSFVPTPIGYVEQTAYQLSNGVEYVYSLTPDGVSNSYFRARDGSFHETYAAARNPPPPPSTLRQDAVEGGIGSDDMFETSPPAVVEPPAVAGRDDRDQTGAGGRGSQAPAEPQVAAPEEVPAAQANSEPQNAPPTAATPPADDGTYLGSVMSRPVGSASLPETGEVTMSDGVSSSSSGSDYTLAQSYAGEVTSGGGIGAPSGSSYVPVPPFGSEGVANSRDPSANGGSGAGGVSPGAGGAGSAGGLSPAMAGAGGRSAGSRNVDASSRLAMNLSSDTFFNRSGMGLNAGTASARKDAPTRCRPNDKKCQARLRAQQKKVATTKSDCNGDPKCIVELIGRLERKKRLQGSSSSDPFIASSLKGMGADSQRSLASLPNSPHYQKGSIWKGQVSILNHMENISAKAPYELDWDGLLKVDP